MTAAIAPTAARRLLEEAARLGVEYIFTNLGSDHPAFIEAFSAIDEAGARMPQIVACPHEMTALSAAHGHAMKSLRPQMVLVHVDVGTQNLGCSIHNAARGRVPAIIVAGLSPVTVSGERVGARTEFIHYTQDTTRQHEIGGQYMKWSYELRAGEMVHQVLMRSIQIASTVPAGPVYLTGAREVWEEPAGSSQQPIEHWAVSRLAGLPEGAPQELAEALKAASRPLVITSYLGRQPDAARLLGELSERYGIAVCEVNPQYVNCPGDHPNHVGYTLLATVDQTIVANRYLYKKLPYDPDKSFSPITMMAESPHILIAKSALPVKDLKELVSLAKREKGKLNYGSYGDGSWPVLVYSTLNAKQGTDLLHIPYKGVAQMMTAAVAGEIDLATGSASVAGEMIKARRIKPLAIAANKRSPQFPDIPTATEQGFPELQASVWYGLFAPVGTQPEILSKIHADVTSILKNPDFTEKQGTARGLAIVANTPQEFSKRIAEDVRATGEMVRAAKITPQ